MNRQSTWAKIHVLLLTLLAAAFLAPGAFAQDGVDLRVDPGAMPGELSLTWTGGQPTFEIFRAATPENVVDPLNKIGETTGNSFVDTPPPGTLWFYVVTSPCVSDPPEVCDGVDNDCNGIVDDPGAESSCNLANATPSCVAGACAPMGGQGEPCDESGDCTVPLACDGSSCEQVIQVTVGPYYPAAADWNQYVVNDGPDIFGASGTWCEVSANSGPGGPDNCIHGGELRRATVYGVLSCSGLSFWDDRAAFAWECDDSSYPLEIR